MDDDNLIPISAPAALPVLPTPMCAHPCRTALGREPPDRGGQATAPAGGSATGRAAPRVRTVTAMPLVNMELGITGIADVVEFHEGPEGEFAFPVEYKRGRPKAHRADEVQLCAQALCRRQCLAALERGCPVLWPNAATHQSDLRRRPAPAHASHHLRYPKHDRLRPHPLAEYQAKRCDACSLLELCQPHLLKHSHDADMVAPENHGGQLSHAPSTQHPLRHHRRRMAARMAPTSSWKSRGSTAACRRICSRAWSASVGYWYPRHCWATAPSMASAFVTSHPTGNSLPASKGLCLATCCCARAISAQ